MVDEEPEEGPRPALQVIVLGSGGGPQENNITALLVRSLHSGWARGSIVAVDAGIHLSGIVHILEQTQPQGLGVDIPLPHKLESGPFAGLEIHSKWPSANAAAITRQLIDTYLITHPHMDHISGFVINTAGLPGTRPKRLAGLPSTISAFKTHIFNNVIWPNLSDENNGAGLVTYTRLVEGGSPALGEGAGKGFLEMTDGLAVKVFGVSHGHCMERHVHRGSASSSRIGSADLSTMSPRGAPGSGAASGPSSLFRNASLARSSGGASQEQEHICVYDSSAYFIRDHASGKEVLIFGDVEPDTISLSPRNRVVWREAAPKIASGHLAAIFIECSYNDSQTNDRLFGHQAPRFIIEELEILAEEVETARRAPPKLDTTKKRKRDTEDAVRRARPTLRSVPDEQPVSPKSTKVRPVFYGSDTESSPSTPHLATPTAELSLGDLDPTMSVSLPQEPRTRKPLKGLKVVIIHVKDNFSELEPAGDTILSELLEHEMYADLGCEFLISTKGGSFLF